MGGTRDVPSHATLHPSVQKRMKACKDYKPRNQGLESLKQLVVLVERFDVLRSGQGIQCLSCLVVVEELLEYIKVASSRK